MNTKELKFLLAHSSIYGLGTVISQAVAFIMLPIYTRHLTPQDYGILELIDTTNMLIGIVITIGISRGMSRFYYENDSHSYRNCVVSTTYFIAFGITLLLLPPLYFSSPYFAKLIFSTYAYKHYFAISFVSLFLGIFLDIGLVYFRLEKKPVQFVSISITRLIVLITLNIIFIVYLELGVLGVLYSTLITRIVYCLLISSFILWKTKIKASLEIASQLIKFCLPMIPANLFNTLIKQSDKYFVLYFMSIADTGIYSLSLKLGNVIHILFTMPFIMTYVPRRFEIMKQTDARQIYRQVFTYFSFLFIFIGLSLSSFAPEVLEIMATEKFYAASQYIPLVVLSMFFFSCQYHFDFGILYSKKTKYFAYINFIVASVHLCLNYFMISFWGIWGAIWASVIVLGSQSFLYLIFSQRNYKIDYQLFRVAKFLALAITFYFISTFVNFHYLIIDLFVKFLLLFAFILTAMLVKLIPKEETEFVKGKIYQAINKFKFIEKSC